MNHVATLQAHEARAPGVEDRSPPGAVDKAMAVLSALIAHGRPMRLAELTRQTGLPKSTVHRLVGILRAHNMIDQRNETYMPGRRLAEVGMPAGSAYLRLLGRVARPYLVDLYQATGASTSLAVLSGGKVSYVDRIYDHRSIRTPSYSSGLAPLHCTATGKILLAHSRDSRRLLHEGQTLAAMTPATITVPTGLLAELCEIRRVGIAYSREEYVSGVVCAAVLVVRGVAHLPPVAVAVSGKAGRLDLAAASAQLPRTALALAATIRQTTSQTKQTSTTAA